MSARAAYLHRRIAVATGGVLAWLVLCLPAHAQFGAGAPPPPANPRAAAPLDLSGYWVSIVTEDWRYRMLTPAKGDFPGVPLNAAGRALANAWDPVADEARGEQCKSYGAPAIMRVPTRLHIVWVDDRTLRIDTDAGEQTRLLHFYGTMPGTEPPSWQGYSVASWEGMRVGPPVTTVNTNINAARRPSAEGYLKVITGALRAGYLRKNGVPYSAAARVEEYFDSFKEPNGDTWLIVTSVVTDPQYLDGSFITSSQFKKEPDAARWHPAPCEAR
ncbi:MAG TPA: hypothetical protein VME21_03505 [Steroidobacteraceae bacterium]|nr:hypothetical protein [Steroidobacteraceae bacterium]